MAEAFDEQEVAAAEALDAEIDRLLVGRAGPTADPVVTWLAAAVRVDPPDRFARRVLAEDAARERHRWLPVQVAAAALAALFLSQGIGNMVSGEWVARGIGEDYSPHTLREGGFALVAVGLAVAAGVFRRSWLPVSVAAGVPLGIALGVNGLPEIGQFAAGALLHTSQGVIAVLLALTWWRAKRYGRGPASEGEA